MIPSYYSLYPVRSTTLWCLLTGRKMTLSSLNVSEEIPFVPGSDALTVTIEDFEFEVARYALHTAKLSRKECLSVLRNGNIRLPASRIELTIPYKPTTTKVHVEVWGGGGGVSSPKPIVDESDDATTLTTTSSSFVIPRDFGPYGFYLPADDRGDCD